MIGHLFCIDVLADILVDSVLQLHQLIFPIHLTEYVSIKVCCHIEVLGKVFGDELEVEISVGLQHQVILDKVSWNDNFLRHGLQIEHLKQPLSQQNYCFVVRVVDAGLELNDGRPKPQDVYRCLIFE